jgi:hypothetical protein
MKRSRDSYDLSHLSPNMSVGSFPLAMSEVCWFPAVQVDTPRERIVVEDIGLDVKTWDLSWVEVEMGANELREQLHRFARGEDKNYAAEDLNKVFLSQSRHFRKSVVEIGRQSGCINRTQKPTVVIETKAQVSRL